MRRKISALSVSVNYADYLECVAPNVKHFDRWLIVTDEKDERTRDVCRRWGMDVLLAQRLYEDGAVFHKAAALNEGLAALDQDSWVAVMDSDILLPHDFRARLEAQALDPACLYGLSGRRICRTLAEFTSLATREPWADNLIFTTFVIGYFNLFHLGQERNRYPEHGSDDASTYDVLFSESFPAVRRRYLPFVCLHAGDASVNWRGRVADPFFEEDTFARAVRPESHMAAAAAATGGPAKRAAQIGAYDGAVTRTLAGHFQSVTVIDHWGLVAGSPAPPLAADLKLTADRYAAETSGLTNVTPPQEHSDRTLAGIPDASLDLLWLTAEPEYDFFLQFLPAWLPKLKPGGTVAGGFYHPELVPGPSRVVQLLLGTPDRVFPDMQWLRRIAHPAALAERLRPVRCDGAPRGVVYVSSGEDDVEAVLVSLHSLRRHWRGPVCVLGCGDESAALRLACIRMGVEFRNVPRCAAVFPDNFNRLCALEWSPFDESLALEAATLVHAPVDFLFDALTEHGFACCAATGPTETPAPAAFAWRRNCQALDSWRALAAALAADAGPRAVAHALTMLRGEGLLTMLPPGPVWQGPAKCAPAGTRIQFLPRLARAGALHLFPPWAAEEQELLAQIQQNP